MRIQAGEVAVGGALVVEAHEGALDEARDSGASPREPRDSVGRQTAAPQKWIC